MTRDEITEFVKAVGDNRKRKVADTRDAPQRTASLDEASIAGLLGRVIAGLFQAVRSAPTKRSVVAS
jgi:hypothetical protein